MTDKTDDETETVTFSVVVIDRVHGRGDLIGMAIVDMDVAGVAIRLQGVQIRAKGAKELTISMPTFKSARDGLQRAAFVLPIELAEAIGATVADAWNGLGMMTMTTGDVRATTALSTR